MKKKKWYGKIKKKKAKNQKEEKAQMKREKISNKIIKTAETLAVVHTHTHM